MRALAEEPYFLRRPFIDEDDLTLVFKQRFYRQVLLWANYTSPGDIFIRFISLEECYLLGFFFFPENIPNGLSRLHLICESQSGSGYSQDQPDKNSDKFMEVEQAGPHE